jgi:hypothetical protein
MFARAATMLTELGVGMAIVAVALVAIGFAITLTPLAAPAWRLAESVIAIGMEYKASWPVVGGIVWWFGRVVRKKWLDMRIRAMDT